MAVVVATRMKVARWRDMPRFLRGSMAAGRQARRSPGLLSGRDVRIGDTMAALRALQRRLCYVYLRASRQNSL